MRKYDVTNKKIGGLTAIKWSHVDKHKSNIWLFKCDCGTLKEFPLKVVTSKKIKSCGCKNTHNYSGLIFNGISILYKLNFRTKKGDIVYRCQCRCGKIFEQGIDVARKGYGCGCEHGKQLCANDISGSIINNFKILKRVKKQNNQWIYECICPFCKNIFQQFTARLKIVKSCGCLLHRKGPENPHYNFNLTDEQRNKRRIESEMLIFRKSVFYRDNYTCQICKKRSTDLNAHHLDGYNWCKEKRIDTNNGIALCINCHESFHNVYGRGFNTKEQFIEYKRLYGNL